MSYVKQIFQAKVWLFLIVFLIFCIMVGYIIFTVSTVYDHITSNWGEFQFTYEHPNLIRNLKQDYASKSSQLEQSYVGQKAQTPQDKLINEVADQLHSSK